MSAKRLVLLLAISLMALARLTRAAVHTVDMTDRPPYLQPQNLDIAVGDTVVWQNHGPELAHAVIDGDLTIFSDDIPVGEGWSHTFQRAGTYAYLCQRHFFMRGTILVRAKDGSLTSIPDYPYQNAFKEMVVPTLNAVPRMIAVSRFNDTVWFTEGGGEFYGFEDIPAQNKLGRIDSQYRIVEYSTPATETQGTKLGVDSVVMDHTGNVWFTERISNRVGFLDPSDTIHEFPLPTKNGEVLGIDVDNTDKVWFAERFGNRIGWMTRDGQVTEIQMPGSDSEPRAVFADSRDRIWYTARAGNEIGYYDKKLAQFNRVSLPTDKARPAGLCETSDGIIYFAEMVANKIGTLVGSQIIEYPTPTKFAAPFKCAVDQANNVWFTEVFGNAIAKLDTRSNEVVEFKIPTADSRPGGIAVDHKGRVWFTEQKGNKIGVFDPIVAHEAQNSAATSISSIQTQLTTSRSTTVKAKSLDYAVPTADSGPGSDLILDKEGWLWFPEIYGNKVAAVNSKSGQFREIALPKPNSMPVGLARSANGILWVTEFRGGRLAKVNPWSKNVEEFSLKETSTLPTSVTVDEEDQVWITEMATGRIARFDPTLERFEEFDMPRGGVAPLFIASDRRGALWITASNEVGNYLARFDLRTKDFQVFDLPTPACAPAGIVVDGDAVWVAESHGAKLARFDIVARRWVEFLVPVARAEPFRLAKDALGRLWLADGGGMGTRGGNSLEIFDPARNRFVVLPMSIRSAKPAGVLCTAHGQVWFTQMGTNLISRLISAGDEL